MTDTTASRLVIIVPADQTAALMRALEGPYMWPAPLTEANGGGLPPSLRAQSNHERFEIEGRAADLIKQFRALPVNSDMPAWMPVSRMDIEAMLNDPSALDRPTVPFSIPRLTPWTDRDEFDEFFPGIEDGPFWDISLADTRRYSMAQLGILPLCQRKTGCMWPPGRISLRHEPGPGQGYDSLTIDYDCLWGPITMIGEILAPVLAEHQARAMMLWEDEEKQCGYSYIAPDRGLLISQDLGDELAVPGADDTEREAQDEDADGVDRQALLARAVAHSEDVDFSEVF